MGTALIFFHNLNAPPTKF